MKNVHDVYDVTDIEIYSCLYCPLTLAIKDELRHHLATKHPDEQPRIYDHSIQNNNNNEVNLTKYLLYNFSKKYKTLVNFTKQFLKF